MKVLISWSGRQSRKVAEVLYGWLPKVLPSLTPWISTQDIDKGKRWASEMQDYLTAANACVVCLTPENMDKPWLYWETGAVALVQKHPICPLLINITPEEIRDNPLVQFQCTYDRKDDVLNLVRSLNRYLDSPEDEMRINGIFETYWDELHNAFKEVAEMGMPENVLDVLKGLGEAEKMFKRRWESEKKAESLDPIRQLVNETASKIDGLMTGVKDERRIYLHCYELKSKVASITSPNARAAIHARGDEIFSHFDKVVAAIRADYE